MSSDTTREYTYGVHRRLFARLNHQTDVGALYLGALHVYNTFTITFCFERSMVKKRNDRSDTQISSDANAASAAAEGGSPCPVISTVTI